MINLTWKKVLSANDITDMEDPITGSEYCKHYYYNIYGKVLDELDGKDEISYVDFFFERHPIRPFCLRFIGENEKFDFIIEDVEIHNNNITAWNTNQDLILRGSGTGFVKVAGLDFKTNISNANGDVAINSNANSTIINSTDALGLPIGTTGQDPAQSQSLRFNTSAGNFVSYTTGPSILSGVTDFDKDTYISTASNEHRQCLVSSLGQYPC